MHETLPDGHHPLQAAIHTMCGSQEAAKALPEFANSNPSEWDPRLMALNLEALDQLLAIARGVSAHLSHIGTLMGSVDYKAVDDAIWSLDNARIEIRRARHKILPRNVANDFQAIYDIGANPQ